jgi:Putative peptidoglycan binding domain
MNKKVIGFSVGLSMVLVSVLGVSAQVMTDTSAPVPTLYTTTTVEPTVGIMPISASLGDVDVVQTSTCLDLQSTSLRYKAGDAMTNGEVSVLQDFLVASSVLKTQVTGFFGLATFSAVKQFQKQVGLNPTGYVGPLTKAKIKEMSCNGVALSQGQNQGKGSQGQSGQGGQNGMMPKPPMTRFENGSGTPPMMGRPPMFGSTTPGFPPRQDMGTGTMKMPPMGVACTALARLCPNGQMMARNPMNCEWITASCDQGMSSSSMVMPRPMPGDTSKPPMGGSATMPPMGVPAKGVMCTMEMRMCPNGTPVPRDANCVWHTEKCATTIPQSGQAMPMPVSATGL